MEWAAYYAQLGYPVCPFSEWDHLRYKYSVKGQYDYISAITPEIAVGNMIMYLHGLIPTIMCFAHDQGLIKLLFIKNN